jgi:hypothetical protein
MDPCLPRLPTRTPHLVLDTVVGLAAAVIAGDEAAAVATMTVDAVDEENTSTTGIGSIRGAALTIEEDGAVVETTAMTVTESTDIRRRQIGSRPENLGMIVPT